MKREYKIPEIEVLEMELEDTVLSVSGGSDDDSLDLGVDDAW